MFSRLRCRLRRDLALLLPLLESRSGDSSGTGAARQPWPALEADLRRNRTLSLQAQLTTALGRIKTLEARDPKPQEEPAEAGNSC
nr:hypothetical protein [Tanacetum cinerariifolium]